MRSTLSLKLKQIKPIPLTSIPTNLLRLPPKPTTLSNNKKSSLSSPTLEKLAASIANPTIKRKSKFVEFGTGNKGAMMDGRGLANAIARDGSVLEIEQEEEEERTEEEVEGGMPSNLRIEEWQGKRVEFMGIKASHRDLLKKLRREG